MRKKIHAVIRQTIQQSFFEYFTILLYYIGLIALSAWLIFNIRSSQKMDPLYFQVMNGDRYSVVTFLKSIQSLPEYGKYLLINKDLYGDEIENEVNSDNFRRRERIEAMEGLLKQNSKARDVLYSLSKLYEVQGEALKADFYRSQAKEIDPMIE